MFDWYQRPAGQLTPGYRPHPAVVKESRRVFEGQPGDRPPPLSVATPVELPPAPPDCSALPASLSSQADVDAWNARRPPGCPPLLPYATLCELPPPSITEREEIIRWNQAHPYCPPIPVPAAPASSGVSTSTVLMVVAGIGGAALLYKLATRK